MNTNEMRYHVLRLFFFHQPEDGWTVEGLARELNDIAPDMSMKPVRTFVNNLADSTLGILEVRTYQSTKHYFLLRESMVYSDPAGNEETEQQQHASDVVAMLLTSMLDTMDQQDAAPILQRLISRIAFTYGEHSRWLNILKSRELLQWQNQQLFGLSLRDLETVYRLLSRGPHKAWTITSPDGIHRLFVFHKCIVRQGVLLCIGTDNDAQFIELRPCDIQSLKEERHTHGFEPVDPRTAHAIEMAHLAIGTSSHGLDHDIILRITCESALKRIQNISMPLDCELDVESRTLNILHPLTTGLVDWIVSLGTGVRVEQPLALCDMVLERLQELVTDHSR